MILLFGSSLISNRIPFGGSQASELLLRLAQLKYPGFPTKVNANQATVSSLSAYCR